MYMEQEKVQVGVIAIRNPANRYEILRTVPIYEEITPQTKAAEEAVQTDIAKILADKMRQYINGGGLHPRMPEKQDSKKEKR